MARSKKGCRASIGAPNGAGNGQKMRQMAYPETDKTSFWGFESENNGPKRQFGPLFAIFLAKIGKIMGQNRKLAPLIDISSAKIGSKLEWAKGRR